MLLEFSDNPIISYDHINTQNMCQYPLGFSGSIGLVATWGLLQIPQFVAAFVRLSVWSNCSTELCFLVPLQVKTVSQQLQNCELHPCGIGVQISRALQMDGEGERALPP